MCGNFGLLMLPTEESTGAALTAAVAGAVLESSFHKQQNGSDALDKALQNSIHEVGRLQGVRVAGDDAVWTENRSLHNNSLHGSRQNNSLHSVRLGSKHGSSSHGSSMLNLSVSDSSHGNRTVHSFDSIGDQLLKPLQILQAQTACTEVRGGQAGGISCLEFDRRCNMKGSSNEEQKLVTDQSQYSSRSKTPISTRVRCVARKRYPLASDLVNLFRRNSKQSSWNLNCNYSDGGKSVITFIGHTRFATASINKVSELHPHEWTPFHQEKVWNFNYWTGNFERSLSEVGIHITHNGDFDALLGYNQQMVNGDVGLWLERVLHTVNNTKGDSPKIAGCMDLFRVQGRWSAAARLAYIRCISKTCTDVSGGEQLSKSAPNIFPDIKYFEKWAEYFEYFWLQHKNNVIKTFFELNQNIYKYTIDLSSEKMMVSSIVDDDEAIDPLSNKPNKPNIGTWSHSEYESFVHMTIRGFLRSDLYTALTEFLSRAEGSFGIQVHCTLEPGVVVIASKGQPMSVAFDPSRPIVLFGSEAEAVAVPVDVHGRWLPERIDLDSHGEIMRVGVPRALLEGSFQNLSTVVTYMNTPQNSKQKRKKPKLSMTSVSPDPTAVGSTNGAMILPCGIEIRCYSLVTACEVAVSSLIDRSVTMVTAPIPYDPSVDLVATDLSVIPAVLQAVNKSWRDPNSIEYVSAESLAENLVACMKERIKNSFDSTDLLIGGIEASLWVAEQFAADMRNIFPQLNVVTVSANKLMSLGAHSPGQVYFAGSDAVLQRRITDNTCVLMISQSGQTFATLHATRKVARIVRDRLWILTGCFNSKMELAMKDSYKELGIPYGRNRVFNNYSGNRPAEPTSVAIVSTFHTLTSLMMHIVRVSRRENASGRLIHRWTLKRAALRLRRFVQRKVSAIRLRKQQEKLGLAVSFDHSLSMSEIQMAAGAGAAFLNDRAWSTTISPSSSGHSGEGKEFVDGYITVAITEPYILEQKSSVDEWFDPKRLLPTSLEKPIAMMLTDECIRDLESLLSAALITDMSDIVGYDVEGTPLNGVCDSTSNPKGLGKTHVDLVEQGKRWGQHVSEPWNIIVLVALYLLVSVGFGLPFIGLLVDLALFIIRSAGVNVPPYQLTFSFRHMTVMQAQPIAWTVFALAVQLLDAIWFVYIGKMLTWGSRFLGRRPFWARHGKRTLVIVDIPWVHQMAEEFTSKLFSQAYGFISLDVHGASGLDHFVHRFTHRVVRGVLLAVGRPDGRLSSLAKSEAAVILATKQAAFIQNPSYNLSDKELRPGEGSGSGPDIVSIGHNPYVPNMGLCHSITLRSDTRGKFVDEIIYERLFLATKPFTGAILRTLASRIASNQRDSGSIYSERARLSLSMREQLETVYGSQHIDPDIETSGLFWDFVANSKEFLTKKRMLSLSSGSMRAQASSCDPAVRSAFSSKLDSRAQQTQDRLIIIQQFYESRIASLERYVSFCVMFHALAESCHRPWLCVGWDVARSQSNLRVATTASPVAAGDAGENEGLTPEIKMCAKQLRSFLRGFPVNF